MKRTLFIISLALFSHFSIAQDCEVLLDALKGEYTGDCKKKLANGSGTAKGTDTYTGEFKKGLPHGLGKYTWANGDEFDGEWSKGLKDGEGKMTYAAEDVTDKIVSGYWSKDEYIGKYAKPYKVWSKSPLVTGVRADKTGDTNEIKVTVNSKGQTVTNLQLNITPTVGFFGQKLNSSNYMTLDNVQFPFRAIIDYQGEKTDIEFQQPGSWLLTLDINK